MKKLLFTVAFLFAACAAEEDPYYVYGKPDSGLPNCTFETEGVSCNCLKEDGGDYHCAPGAYFDSRGLQIKGCAFPVDASFCYCNADLECVF